MKRTILIMAGPFWFGLALVFLSSLMMCLLKRMPPPPWDSEEGFDLPELEDSPAPFGLGTCVD